MSLARKIASFVTSPQGRRTIQQARTRLDTPENRKRLSGVIGKARGVSAPPTKSAPARPVEGPAERP